MDGTRNGNQGQSVSWRVEGMDCASCVAKVEKAVTRQDTDCPWLPFRVPSI